MATPTVKDVGNTVRFRTGTETLQGVLRYFGKVDGQVGDWCGVELRDAKGKNNGTVKDKVYFRCAPKHGIFVKKDATSLVASTKSPSKRLSTVPSTPTAPKPAAPTAKRTSIAPTARSSTARQSISSLPPRKTPTSRPTSQTISRETAQLRSRQRISVQSEPPEDSVQDGESSENQKEEDVDEEDEEEDEEQQDQVQVREPSRRTAPTEARRGHTRIDANAGEQPSNKDALSASQLSRENGALKVKLQTMEKRRMEDRDTIKRVETLQSENDHLSNIIKTLQVKVRTTTEERREAQTKVQALEQQLQAEPERPAQFESELELATLNKEMAEEKAEALQKELDILRAKHEELSLESEILREEHDELASSMTDEERANAGWLHLERERDRLREALLLLRDNKQEIESQLREEIEQLQDNLNETEETAAKYLDTAEALHRAEDTNLHLKDQLEAAENQEDVISTMLSERDRHLSQIESMRSHLSELEELAETNQDLEAFYVENEKAMLVRLDQQEAKVHDRDQAVRSQHEKIEGLEYTINKYHKVVQDLQSDIEEARRTKEISELRANEMNTKSRAMLDLKMSLQKDATKSQAQAINIELAKAEARLKSQHVEILSLYLPESFDAERTPVAALLSFSRLKTKSAIVASILSDRLRNGGHLEPGEETLACFKIVHSMRWIRETADRFERFMSSCSTAEYVAFSNANQDVEPVERVVTDWLEQLKNNELGNDGPDRIKRMQSILSDLAEKLMPNNAQTKTTHLLADAHMIESHADIAASLLEWLKACVKTKLVTPDGDDDPEEIHFTNKTSQLATRARSLRLAGGRVIGELERNRSKKVCLDETAWPLFIETEQHASVLIERVQELCHTVLAFFNDDAVEDERSYSTLSDALDISDSDIFSELQSNMNDLHAEIENLAKKSADLTSSTSFEPLPAPWISRAKDMKAQRNIPSEVTEELSQLQNRNIELVNRIAEKERAIEEVTIKAEHFEKRVKDNRSKEGSEKALRNEIEKLTSQRQELETKLSTLRAELVNLQDQNKHDKDEIKSLQSQLSQINRGGGALGGMNGGNMSGIEGLPNEVTSMHIKSLVAQITSLESTVRYLRWENKELTVPISETKYRVAQEAWLNPANLKRRSTNKLTTSYYQTRSSSSTTTTRNNTSAAAEKQKRYYHDALINLVHDPIMSKQIRLAETWQEGDAWRSEKETGKWLVAQQRHKLATLRAIRDR